MTPLTDKELETIQCDPTRRSLDQIDMMQVIDDLIDEESPDFVFMQGPSFWSLFSEARPRHICPAWEYDPADPDWCEYRGIRFFNHPIGPENLAAHVYRGSDVIAEIWESEPDATEINRRVATALERFRSEMRV